MHESASPAPRPIPEMPPVNPGAPVSRLRSDMLNRSGSADSRGSEAGPVIPAPGHPGEASEAPSRHDRFYGAGGDTVSVRAHTQFYRGEGATASEPTDRRNRFYGGGGPTVSVRAHTQFYRGGSTPESRPPVPESKGIATPSVARAAGEVAVGGTPVRPSRIRGKNFDPATRSFVGEGTSEPAALAPRPRSAAPEHTTNSEVDRSPKTPGHAPTWELKFGKHGTGYGNLDMDGFEAMNSNSVSGEDAFAVNEEGTRFAVTDGLGGSAASNKENGGTAFFAKFIADAAVTHGADVITDPKRLVALYAQAEDAFEALTGERF